MPVEPIQIGFKIECKGFQKKFRLVFLSVLLRLVRLIETKSTTCAEGASSLDICMLSWLFQLLVLTQFVASFFAYTMVTSTDFSGTSMFRPIMVHNPATHYLL